MRVVALALLLTLTLPLAQAQASGVTIEDLLVPERTRAELPFGVALTLRNDGPARTVTLFGALYDEVPGQGPCGPATDPRFRTFTHLVQQRVDLPAGATVQHPPTGKLWLQQYARDDASAAPEEAEFCVFVAEAESATATIEYLAYTSTPLSVRAQNAPPQPRFTWTPEAPGATLDATFSAEATDAEGDPVSYQWDFGHLNASGRAVAEGARATHFFYPAGEYVVTLTASDGMDSASVMQTVRVAEAPSPSPERAFPVPGAAAFVVMALLVASSLRRR